MIKYFKTDSGIRMEAISAETMRKADKIAVSNNSPNLFQMMENAGRNLAELTLKITGGDWEKRKILILAGRGGNGSGGICAARHLANRGSDVSLCLIDRDGLKGVPLSQLNIYRETGGKFVELEELKNESPGILIDAMIGYSLNSLPKENYLTAIEFANSSGAEILSLDIPTGINSTTGKDYGAYVKAGWTLTLAYPKSGLSEAVCGKLFLGDIGIPAQVFISAGIDYTNPFDNRWIVPIAEKG